MKISKRQLVMLIKEATMYNPRGRRDAAIDRLGEPITSKLKNLIDKEKPDPVSIKQAHELIKAFPGGKFKNPHPDFPDATDYGEEIGQFDQKMRAAGQQHYENKLTPKEKKLRKLIVDNLFHPQGDWRIPVDRLTNPNLLFNMHFMLWSEIIPEDHWDYYSSNPGFELSVERVLNSLGGSHYAGNGDTLIPFPRLTQQDQLVFNQVILKVLNGDPQYV
jgi:hypothetical protein